MEMNSLETGGIIVLALGLVEVIKMLINRRNGKKECQKLFPDEQKQQLKTLHDLHVRFDDDGSPLWYVPRSWGENQKTIVEILHNISSTQGQHTKILDKIIERMDS